MLDNPLHRHRPHAVCDPVTEAQIQTLGAA